MPNFSISITPAATGEWLMHLGSDAIDRPQGPRVFRTLHDAIAEAHNRIDSFARDVRDGQPMAAERVR